MRKAIRLFERVIASAVICLALLAVLVAPVMAAGLGQDPAQAPDPLAIVLDLALSLGGLVGVAGFVVVLVNVGKWIGFIQDGTSAAWSAGLNLVIFGVLVGVRIFNPAVTLAFMDEKIGQLAQIGVIILGYLTQIVSSGKIYAWVKTLKIPVVSKSFSG